MSPFQLKYLAATLAVGGISVAGCSNTQDAAPTAAPAGVLGIAVELPAESRRHSLVGASFPPPYTMTFLTAL